MVKCQACGDTQDIWSWQPDLGLDTFTFPGNHYRGFSVIKVCDVCKEMILKHEPIEFSIKGARFILDGENIKRVPEYVSDALLWIEETNDTRIS